MSVLYHITNNLHKEENHEKDNRSRHASTIHRLHRHGKLMPYANKNNGLFEVKECINERTPWSGTQTLITPKGRDTFRHLYPQMF